MSGTSPNAPRDEKARLPGGGGLSPISRISTSIQNYVYRHALVTFRFHVEETEGLTFREMSPGKRSIVAVQFFFQFFRRFVSICKIITHFDRYNDNIEPTFPSLFGRFKEIEKK